MGVREAAVAVEGPAEDCLLALWAEHGIGLKSGYGGNFWRHLSLLRLITPSFAE